ncbi:ty3-gypsy retrotransposon protein [Cucumis melo var. makuwa]|uniref:Ty3-gypsy retrotransposon protein n=1 Tax=Cucumis melo var. makuwa TaxID=1194695 RepID=A0A5D3BYM1_CUCMM|nr:ty3-gypsy retrotransposon protein [Cucumis melo var. makuwa]
MKEMTKAINPVPMRTKTLREVSPTETPKEGTFRRLSDVEFKSKRERGLCFRCDEHELEVFEDACEEFRAVELQAIKVNDVVELSMNSVWGNSQFHCATLVKEEKLRVESTANYGIIMGIGTVVKGKGLCKGVRLQLTELSIVEELLALQLG